MMLSMFIMLAAAVFISQLVFCLFAKWLWIKLLPVGLVLGMDLICWMLYFFSAFSDTYGGDFAAFLYAIVLAIVAGVAGFAWGIYGIVKLVHKQRK